METLTLSADEERLVEMYRQLTPADKNLTLALIGKLCVGEHVGFSLNVSDNSFVLFGSGNTVGGKGD